MALTPVPVFLGSDVIARERVMDLVPAAQKVLGGPMLVVEDAPADESTAMVEEVEDDDGAPTPSAGADGGASSASICTSPPEASPKPRIDLRPKVTAVITDNASNATGMAHELKRSMGVEVIVPPTG